MTVTINDLPDATSLNVSDQFMVRQPAGALGVDKKVTLALLQNINFSILAVPPVSITNGDLLLLNQAGVNYKVSFQDVGFISGIKMWFYEDVAPIGWTAETFGDVLLAVKGGGGATYLNGGVLEGDWQLPNMTLTTSQIPPHTHTYQFATQGGSGDPKDRPKKENAKTNFIGETNSTGGGDPHHHGDTFRPKSAVGIVCIKN